MGRLTIVSGCPGSGKSTLSKRLAHECKMGVCIESDVFYDFLAHRIDPTLAESKPQNTAVIRAFLKAARSFYDDGYEVFVDGVIGPWWLETIDELLPKFEYVVLHASLETVLQRTRERAEFAQASASPEIVRVMHGQFAAVNETETASRTINTTDMSVEAVYVEFLARQAKGDFR